MIVRVKGFQIFKDRHDKLRCYHRATKTPIDLNKVELGSIEFFNECRRIAAIKENLVPRPGTWGLLVKEYKASPAWQELQPKTREWYEAAKVKVPDQSPALLCQYNSHLKREHGLAHKPLGQPVETAAAVSMLKRIVKEHDDHNTLFADTASAAKALINEIEG